MDETKVGAGVLVCLILGLVTLVLSGMFISDWHIHRMAELGYEQRMVVGSYNPVWQKTANPTVVVCDCGCPKAVPVSLAPTNDTFSGWSGNIVMTNDIPRLRGFVNGRAVWE